MYRRFERWRDGRDYNENSSTRSSTKARRTPALGRLAAEFAHKLRYHQYMPREDEELQSAFEEQAGSASGSRELCDLFGLDAGGSHAALRDRIFSLVTGPPSRRRWGWLDLLLQVHAAGAQSVDDLEPEGKKNARDCWGRRSCS